jgi:hypothetical protein
MTTREALHQLVDALPEDTLPAVERYLDAVRMGCPPEAPFEDEELSDEEIEMLEASRAAVARGEPTISHEEMLARLDARREKA